MFSTTLELSLDLLLNVSLLVSLVILSGSIEKRLSRKTFLGALLQGTLFGVTAVIGMLRPLILAPGLIFDGRSVIIGLCALFFGPWSAAVAVVLTIGCRFLIGGTGMVTGALVILSSAVLGLGARRFFNPDDRPPDGLRLYAFGLVVHIAMLALMFTLPDNAGLSVIRSIGLPVIVLYPFATILAGTILSDRVEVERVAAALSQSEERFKLSMEAANDGLWDLDIVSNTAFYSPAYYRILGFEPGETMAAGRLWETRLHPDDAEMALKANRDCIEGRTDHLDIVYRMESKDGGWRWIRARGKCIARDGQGVGTRLIGTHVDITDQKMIEERLQRNLEEKGILLREVHHRVKNNLNVISSLLNLQAATIKTPAEAIAAFGNSRDRIKAMSLVHEELYRSEDYSRVDMVAYIRKLTGQLHVAYSSQLGIRIGVNVDGIAMGVSASIPCGLILNELITNALKHAFKDRDSGVILVSLKESDGDSYELSVSDDGIGIQDGPDRSGAASLGLTLVRLLVEQLDGVMDVVVKDGTTYSIRFPRSPAA